MDRKNKYSLLTTFFLIIILVWIVLAYFQPEKKVYQFPSPVEVVRLYFASWDNKNYSDMYSTFSDGFKHLEPTAQDLASFRAYVMSQNITAVTLHDFSETSNDGETATVVYDVEFTLSDGKHLPFQGTFTLKNRQSDIIRGWKLIHPYGEKIDTA